MAEPKPQEELPQELSELTEQLAARVHDIWAEGRISEGWTWGPQKDPQARRTPQLVPYDELPESEKEFDRRTALGTLQMIQSLGYEIRKK